MIKIVRLALCALLSLSLVPVLAGAALPSAAATTKTCVTAPQLRKVKVGMSLTKAKSILKGKKVSWGPSRSSYSQSFPVPCNQTRAMLIHAEKGRITAVVNQAEVPRKTCTTFARMDTITKGMTKATVTKILAGRHLDYQAADEWMPEPCQPWALMHIAFTSKNKVAATYSDFYYG